MDTFRELQKETCHDGSPSGGKRPYGCSCCRKHGDLSKHKKYSRRLARVRLNQKDKKNLIVEEETVE